MRERGRGGLRAGRGGGGASLLVLFDRGVGAALQRGAALALRVQLLPEGAHLRLRVLQRRQRLAQRLAQLRL